MIDLFFNHQLFLLFLAQAVEVVELVSVLVSELASSLE
jgi:hypothetical protein